MRLLMLGGTGFVGRAVVEEALSRRWSVTLSNRGTREVAVGAGATVLRGDRLAPDGLAALAEGEWDLVVDTWSGRPSAVRDAARLLADRAGGYVYISSGSVYAEPVPPGAAENAPVVDASPDDGEVEYARAKAGGELAVRAAFGEERALFVRAGLILGPGEDIGRLPWWLNRIARGGPVLAPGPADLRLQFIDVRDLAAWTLDAAERGLTGPYNVVARPGHTTMGELLEACARVTGSDARLCWAAPETVLAAGLQPWMDLPIWLPPGQTYDFIHRMEVGKAVAAGLRCRPATRTVADTWTWLQHRGGQAPQRADRPVLGLDPEMEATILAALT